MQVRKIDLEKDLPEISVWWVEQNWTPIPKSLLPKTGFIIDNYAAGFLYTTDSDFGVMEWIIANPNTKKEIRREALDLLIKALLEEADNKNIKAIFTSAEHKGLIERYKKHGFKITDRNMTNLVRLK